MSLNNNITDISGRDFQVETASNANEMATSNKIYSFDNILDIGADERVKSDDNEESDPNFPDVYQPQEPEKIELGDFDELLLIEMQQQEEENAMIKGYPMPKYN